jgi:TIR domain
MIALKMLFTRLPQGTAMVRKPVTEEESKVSMKPSIFLSHNVADKAFVRRLATDLRQAGAGVWLDDAEIRIGDSLIEKIETGLVKSDYLGIVLTPNSINSNWVKAELRAILSRELADGKVRGLAILYRDCELPPFLVDKRYADFRKGSYRKALMDVLIAMGLSYEPVRQVRLNTPYDPLVKSVVRILGIKEEQCQRLYATALHLSISAAFLRDHPDLSIPYFIEQEYSISLKDQSSYYISLPRRKAYKFLRSLGRGMKSFMKRGLELRYQQRFSRKITIGLSSPDHYIFSYCELLEWFDIPINISMPSTIEPCVLWDHLPATSESYLGFQEQPAENVR